MWYSRVSCCWPAASRVGVLLGILGAPLRCTSLLMRGKQVMEQVLGSLLPTGETQVECPAPGFSLAQPWLAQAFGREPVNERALSVSQALSVSLSFK